MKKLFTLVSAAVLGVSTMFAVTPQLANKEMTQHGKQKVAAMFDQLHKEKALGITNPNVGTRSFVVGNQYWTMQVLHNQDYAITMWTNDEGLLDMANGGTMTVDEIVHADPWTYSSTYCLLELDMSPTVEGGDGAVFEYILFWPSYLQWNQLQDNPETTVDEANLGVPSLDQVANSTKYCRSWLECGGYAQDLVPNVSADGETIESYGLVFAGGYFFPKNERTMANKKDLASQFSATNASSPKGTFDLRGFIASDEWLTATLRANVQEKVDAGMPSFQYTWPLNFDGAARVDGFGNKYPKLEIGDITLISDGVISPAILGDVTIWDGDFEELTQWRLWGVDPWIELMVKASSTGKLESYGLTWREEFAKDATTEEMEQHQNWFSAYIYTKPSATFPHEAEFKMGEPKWVLDEFSQEYYWSLAPSEGMIVPQWNTREGWASLGAYINYTNYNYYPSEYTTIAFGTPEGFRFETWCDYQSYFDIKSTKDIIVYGDVNKMDAPSEKFSPVGGMQYANVEEATVAAMNVAAANGEINVTVAENAEVMVYSLNGAAVAGKALNAGETLNVKADKGVYVVKAGKDVVKVIL